MERVDQLGHLRVALLRHLRHLTHVGRAGVGDHAAAAREHPADLGLGVLAAEAQAHEVAGRQTARALRGEGTVTVEGVLHVDDLAVDVRANADAAAHVADDQVQLVIARAVLLGIALGDGLLVQRVELAAALDQGMAGVFRDGRHLVHHGRVDDVGGDIQLVGNLAGEDAAEVRRMLSLHALDEVDHDGRRHLIGAAGDRLHQAAAAADGAQLLHVEVVLCQRLEHQLLAEVLLIGDCRELGNLLRAVAQGLVEEQLLILKHADFRGGGAGVNHQNFVRHDCFLLNYYDSLIL